MKNNFFSQKLMIVIILVSTTLILYWQVSGFDFVGYDDSLYISPKSLLGIALPGHFYP